MILSKVDFKAAFEAMPGLYALILPDAPRYTLLATTEDYIKATGQQKTKLAGRGIFESFPTVSSESRPEEDDALRASLDFVVENKKAHVVPPHRYDTPGEGGVLTERYWTLSNKPVLDDSGGLLYIIHCAQEVTEKVKSEKREEQFRDIERAYQLFMQAPVIITIVKGPDYVIELANRNMLELWGRGPEVVGKKLLDAIPELEGQGFIELLDSVRYTGKAYEAKESPAVLMRHGRKETRYINFIYQPYYDGDDKTIATGVIGVAHDVTEQVLARNKVEEVKERLNFRNALFEAQNGATPDGVLIVDAKGKMLLWNKLFVEIWKMPRDIIDRQDDGAALTHAMTMVAEPEKFIEKVTRLYKAGNKQSYDQILFRDGRIIERNGTPILAENGLYYGWAWYFRDITQRIRQEQKFQNVVQQASDPILILKGEDLVLEVANKALFDLWQVGPEAIGKKFTEILPEMEAQGFVDLLLGVLHTGQPFHGKETSVVFQRHDGTEQTVYFNFVYQPYREADGSITGVLVMATDVTGQVEAKMKLVESEHYFRNMILQAPVAVCILKGPQYIIEIANDRMGRIMGRPQDQLIQKPLFEAIPEVARQGYEELLLQAYSTGKSVSVKERPVQLLRDGKMETIWVDFVYEPLKESDGSISRIMVVVIDITEKVSVRKQMEESSEELRMALEIAELGTYRVNLKTKTAVYSERIRQWFGLTQQNLELESIFQKIHPDDQERIVNVINNTMVSEQGSRHDVSYRIIQPDGTLKNFRSFGKTLFNAGGKPYVIIGTIQDITPEARNQKKIEESEAKLQERVLQRTAELENLNEELKRSNANLEEFAYAASHDMKEPIRKIHYFADRLKGDLAGKLDEGQRRLFERMEQATKRMGILIDDLLLYSHISRGAALEEVVDLNQKVSAVLEDLELEIMQRHAEVNVGNLPLIKGHRRQLQQLFQNLVSNALKYSKPDVPPKISVTSKKIQGKDSGFHLTGEEGMKTFHLIEVSDNGIGFDTEDAERIFNVFTRLHGNAEYRGSGVGLSIVRKVVQNHHGYIKAEGRPGEGACFRILLPGEEGSS